MSISSLGGPMKVGYLTLPRTRVRDQIAFATGGVVGIPELNEMTEAQLLEAVQLGQLDPKMAQQIIMGRRQQKAVDDLKAPFETMFPNEGPRGLQPQQASVAGAMQRQGGRPELPQQERREGTGIGSLVPQAVKDWWNSTPSKPFDTPEGKAMRQGIGDSIGIRGRPTGDRYAEQWETAMNDPAPEVSGPPQLRAPPANQRQPGLPPTPLTRDPYAEQFESANIIPAPRVESRPVQTPDIPRIYDTPSMSPDGAATQAGIDSLPTPPQGAATPQPGGIVPPQDPMQPDAYAPNATPPAQDPMEPDAYRSDEIVTGSDGTPQSSQAGGVDTLRQLQSAAGPQAKAAAEGADSIFGKGRGWEALMMLGLGMMASKNPSALGAAGEGGIAALKYLGDRRKEDREVARDAKRDALDERKLAQGDRQLDISEANSKRSEAYYSAMTKKVEAEAERAKRDGGDPAEVRGLKWKFDLINKAKSGDKEAQQFVDFLDKNDNERTFRSASEKAMQAAGNITFEVPGKPTASFEEKYDYAMRMQLGSDYKNKYNKSSGANSGLPIAGSYSPGKGLQMNTGPR